MELTQFVSKKQAWQYEGQGSCLILPTQHGPNKTIGWILQFEQILQFLVQTAKSHKVDW
jgi:hypothetical protein